MPRMLMVLLVYTFAGAGVMAYEEIYPQTDVGTVELKEIPARTELAAEGTGDPFEERNAAFGKLFEYIKENDVAMTVPVETGATSSTMSFFVGSRDADKPLTSDTQVNVRPMPPRTVVSAGLRGSYTEKQFREGVRRIGEWLAARPEWIAEGEPYAVYWNSPFVPGFLKRAEVHQPVVKAEDEATSPSAGVASGDISRTTPGR